MVVSGMVIFFIVIAGLIVLSNSIKIVREYKRLVVFRHFPDAGFHLREFLGGHAVNILPFGDRLHLLGDVLNERGIGTLDGIIVQTFH